MLSNKQRKILGWVLLSPLLLIGLVSAVSFVFAFPKVLVLIGFVVATVTGIFLLIEVREKK